MRQHLFSACGRRAFGKDGSLPDSLSNKITKLSLLLGKVNIKLVFGIFNFGINLGSTHIGKTWFGETLHLFALGNSSAVPVVCWWVLQLLPWCQCPPAQSLPSRGSLGGWQKMHCSHGQNSICLLPEGFIINQIIIFQSLTSRLLIWNWILFSSAFWTDFFSPEE